MESTTRKISLRYSSYLFAALIIIAGIAGYAANTCETSYWDEAALGFSLLVASVAVWAAHKYLILPIEALGRSLTDITTSEGDLDIPKFHIEEFNNVSAVISTMSVEIKNATEFVNNIEQGNIDIDYRLSDTNHNSLLTTSLLNMRDKMKDIASKEKERNWATEGLAKFVEVLRSTQMNLGELADEMLSKLVKYIGVNQGGLFVLNKTGQKQTLDLIACYAYDRKKFVKKEIEIGEGLVGQAYLEKDIIYITEVPQGYTTITSGMGDGTPRCVLIVPLMVNEEVFGVLELASFRELKQYQIEFVQKLGESIASTISTAMINDSTKRMLEDSQIRTEQMKAQEEELRQNMEELHATQEETMRKEKEIKRLLESSLENERALKDKIAEIHKMEEADKIKTDKMLAEVEDNRLLMRQVIDKLPEKIFLKDENGRFVILNQALAEGLARSVDELIGKNDFDLFARDLAENFWKAELEVINGKTLSLYEDFPCPDGSMKYFHSTKMPFKFPNSDKIGILGYQVDITDTKLTEQKIKGMEDFMAGKEKELHTEIRKKQEIIDEQIRKILELQSHEV